MSGLEIRSETSRNQTWPGRLVDCIFRPANLGLRSQFLEVNPQLCWLSSTVALVNPQFAYSQAPSLWVRFWS